MMAGCGVGGGTRVNWCASFPTPAPVRQEWADQHGIAFATTQRYTDALDAVLKRLGVHEKPDTARDFGASAMAAGLKVCLQR